MLKKIAMTMLLTAVFTSSHPSMTVNAQSSKDKEKTPPVKKVVLYKHGMGYFERIGRVKDDATITLDFKADQMQDLLTSLFAIDYGGKITSIGYDSKDPIHKQLENILIRVQEDAALTQFITQLKGVKVEIKVGIETACGSILGIEPINQKMDNTVLTSYKVVLLREDGAIQPFNLLDVSSMRILDERIQEDLQRILDIYKNSKYTDRKQIKIQTTGKGERNIKIGYLIEMPIWKTSYRLILAEDAKPYLQGWAIMENPTDEDWNNIDVSFVAGNPISFKMDLYTSYYPIRPIIDLGSLIPLVSSLVDLGKFAAEKELEDYKDKPELRARKMKPRAPAEKRVSADGENRSCSMDEGLMFAPGALSPSIKMSEMLSQSISAIATGAQIGELFAYESKAPISVSRRQAAMVPIVSENIDGSKTLYHRSSISPKLMNAFYLTNSSKLTLEAGPVNIFEGSTAVGEGLFRQPLQPQMKEIIHYAIEAGCSIETTSKGEPKPVHKASFVNGVMVLKQYDIRENIYKCINKTPKGFTLYIDHPRFSDYTLIEPVKFDEEIAGHYRFKTDLPAGKTIEFKVREQKEISSNIYLQNQSMDQIRFYLTQDYLSKKSKVFLEEIMRCMNEIAEQERIITEAGKESEKLARDQDRYRKNMGILHPNNPRESEKRAEYLERLTNIETRLENLDQAIREATDKQRKIRDELNQKIRGFTEE
jgi:hypothetical protein